MPRNIGILLSGRGSNFVALADSVDAGRIPNAQIALVISNRSDAPGIETARNRGLSALVIPSKGRTREDHDREIVAALREAYVDVICLAGYMRLLSPWFVQQFPNRILNIHPSLLPAFPGLDAQKQAFDYGVRVSGCTVHFVDEHLDHGAIILQKVVPVLDTDDDHALAARILEQEHLAYTEAVRIVLEGKYEIVDHRVVLKT
jgi:phosphoribosylglycinamide formyltransferase 1